MARRITSALIAALFVAEAAAQGALAGLGLTEAAARNLLFNEIKAPSLNRQGEIAVAGTAAFLKIPPAARAAAATGLFAWARSYTSSPAFATVYAQHRKNVGADSGPAISIEQEIKAKVDATLAEIDQARKDAAQLPPDAAAKMLAAIKQMEENARSPAMLNAYRMEIEATRANQNQGNAELALKFPPDPRTLFSRRLREFLDATRDVNFNARTMSLNGGPDAIVFLDRADRKRHWMWQLAVMAGPEATGAARAAAEAWLKEIPQ